MSKEQSKGKVKRLFNIDKFSKRFYPDNPVIHSIDHGIRPYTAIKAHKPAIGDQSRNGGCNFTRFKLLAA